MNDVFRTWRFEYKITSLFKGIFFTRKWSICRKTEFTRFATYILLKNVFEQIRVAYLLRLSHFIDGVEMVGAQVL